MKIAIGSDHRGLAHKSHLIASCVSTQSMIIDWVDCGCHSLSCDYPRQAVAVVEHIRSQACSAGVLLCGTGIGMAIAANRFKGIYAALVWTPDIARLSRQHENANILVIPADYVSLPQMTVMIKVWLESSFEGGRHARRIGEIDSLGGA